MEWMSTPTTFPMERFGDRRLSARQEWLSGRIAKAPGASFPRLSGSDSDLEAIYRFLNNARVTHQRMLEPHFQTTAEAVAKAGQAYVIHDTSQFSFSGEAKRRDLGRLGRGRRENGFYAHFALAVSADGKRTPLGLLGLIPYVLKGPAGHGAPQKDKRKSGRWAALCSEVEQKLARAAQAIHLMDREADDYQLLEQLALGKNRFILRARYDRLVGGDASGRLRSVMEGAESVLVREVFLSRRRRHKSHINRKIHPPRNARPATLHCRAQRVCVARPDSRASDCGAPALELNLVQVLEPAPPKGEQGVEWLLFTTEPVDTPGQVGAVVDGYRTRWLIEEYFKALKTGCAYETRQLESLHALLNALAILAPAAVELLRIRSLARDGPHRRAAEVATPVQIAILRRFSRRHPLGHHPTARDVMLAIAGMGGHIKNNGEPGWQVLHLGYRELLAMEAGWSAALASQM